MGHEGNIYVSDEGQCPCQDAVKSAWSQVCCLWQIGDLEVAVENLLIVRPWLCDLVSCDRRGQQRVYASEGPCSAKQSSLGR